MFHSDHIFAREEFLVKRFEHVHVFLFTLACTYFLNLMSADASLIWNSSAMSFHVE